MRRCSQQEHLQRAIKRKRENALRRSRLGVLARERKRIQNPRQREPELIRFYPLEFAVRDKRTGEQSRWIDVRSARDVARRIGMLLRFYE